MEAAGRKLDTVRIVEIEAAESVVTTVSHFPPSDVVGTVPTKLEVVNSNIARAARGDVDTDRPTRTVTVTVWGASTAFGSLTVRMAVLRPCGRPVVLTATWIVEQFLPTA